VSQEHQKNLFVGEIAAHYDADSTGVFHKAVIGGTVDFLAELAGEGRALEFAIGTGRIAVPLSECGVPVAGIELSSDMVAQLKKKPGSEAIDVTIGDMTSARVDGSFRLVYLVYNTIGNLLSQDDQVECFCNAAAHLEPGGCFVVEVIVPPLRRLPPGESSLVFTLTPQRVGYDEIDVANQLGVSHHIWFREDGPQKFATPWRLVWPAELDLMARIAGLRLRERWGDWDRSPFTGDSMKHVSVWGKPAG
jgi:SAM-dependent methyltransferase